MDESNRRNRKLSKDERELWLYAMRDAIPLHGEEREPSGAMEIAEAPPSITGRRLQTERPAAPVPQPKPSIPRTPPSPLGHLDRRQTRVIATGRVEIDARLDLHGYRQLDAYSALRGFLATAQARGYRVVLIITGKGIRKSRGDWHDGEYETGVLRRMVPRWLREPEFRHMVIEFGPSDIRHGGDGALYVRIRRQR